jgi:hypothetical protein
MTQATERLLLEHMTRFQAEQAAACERDIEILSRLSGIESGIARLERWLRLTP